MGGHGHGVGDQVRSIWADGDAGIKLPFDGIYYKQLGCALREIAGPFVLQLGEGGGKVPSGGKGLVQFVQNGNALG